MNRRRLLLPAGAAALLPVLGPSCASSSKPVATSSSALFRRVRPSDPAWPSAASWERLNREIGGQLVTVRSPLAACVESMQSPACADFISHANNPYYLGDEVGLTQTLGWVDAWTSRPSVYAVAARTTADVVAAV